MQFSLTGWFKGFKSGIPIALGVASYGLVFGILSKQAGLDLIHSLCMSAFVFAGASQFVAMDMWTAPLPVVAIIVTTFVVNMRHLLMGAVLVEKFKRLSRFQTYVSLFFLVDENWAYSLAEWKKGNQNAALLAGTGFCLFLSWTISTGIGSILGSADMDPVKWGIDFAFTAIFIFLATAMWRDKRDLVPWMVAATVAILFSKAFPGKWYILAGSLSGSMTGVLIHD
ncbi:MAG: AzlC family ABC transporter permease [Proteobacteria bacterium]|nr:AzlC family ABC transporter permease [Pseudomonadota bacterium]MBU1585927.1 AzlC family ABC transporter permease [Pseudomonadota bacterium]MBU2455251.1 AzlC family ABC transporter permease [Pseudomonadota bacterium]MBU2628573.1 AzlC family ABC transporter permease [Pseudomonadota bacterium]